MKKDIEYLKKELKKYQRKYSEAEMEGYETDAEMWLNNIDNIRYQIHIHEQAAKADEYEAKAKLADKLISELRDSSYYVNEGTKDLMISMCLTEIKRHENSDSHA